MVLPTSLAWPMPARARPMGRFPGPTRSTGSAGPTLTDILQAHLELFAAYGLDSDLLAKLEAEVGISATDQL